MGRSGAPGRPAVVAVASGKGGVGKTSVAIALARALAAAGRTVGLVDADLHGPDVPRMLGIRRDAPARSITLAHWSPTGARTRGSRLEAVEVDGVQVASAGFLMGGGQGLAVDATFATMLLGRLIHDTTWKDVDVLVVDLPPGTGDVQQALLGLVERVASVLVVTPAEVSHLDTSRAVAVLRSRNVTILGGVENMAYLRCPHCAEPTELFVPAAPERTIWAQGVPKLDRLAFRPDGIVDGADLAATVAALATHLDGT